MTVSVLSLLATALLHRLPCMTAACLAQPNLTLMLLLAGVFLIYLEMNRPGAIVPGSLGAFLTLLALFGLSRLPLRPGALWALLAGLVLLAFEVLRPQRFIFAAAGMITVVIALRFLVAAPNAAHQVQPLVALLVGAPFSLVTLVLARIALRARRSKRVLHRPALHTSRPKQPGTA